MHQLYEKSIISKYLNAIEEQDADTLTKDLAEATSTVHQPVKKEEEKKPEPEIPQVKLPEPEKKIVAEEKKESPKLIVEPEVLQPPVPPVETKKTPEPPKVTEQPKTTSSESSRTRPDLKSFIGLNEKIMFLRHLFRNDTAAYDEVIRQINSSQSLTEAITFTDVVKNEFAWKADDEIVQAFYDLIRRRFA
jgi:outer membrane biosynthesis protein TonB